MEQRAKNIVFERLMKLIEKYQDKEWEWEYISSNINLTIEMINKPWNWNSISENPNITMEIILSVKELLYRKHGIQVNFKNGLFRRRPKTINLLTKIFQ